MFFGAVVEPGKKFPLVPHPEGFALHLSQASLAANVKEGTRVSLLVTLGPKEQPVVLCTLKAGSQDTVLLDQFMTEYAELSVQGGSSAAPVHVTGYFSPQYGPEDDGGEDEEGEEEEDEEYALPGHPLDLMQYQQGLTGGMDDSDEDEEDEDESEEDESEDEDEDEDESEEDEDESSEDDIIPGRGRKEPSVIIEDITDQENVKAAKAAGAANGDVAQGGKKRKAAAALPAPEADGAAAAKKQAVAAAPEHKHKEHKHKEQQQQQQAQTKQQQTPADKKQQQQQTPKQQQQATPQEKQQQQQQKAKQGQATPVNKAAAAAAASPAAAAVSSSKKNVRVFENGFEIHSLKMGDPNGKLAKGGKTVKVRYVGRLKSNGKVFDKTDKKPFAFRLGVGEVIKGWDRGVEGMRVGDKRKLVIPPQMGYGAQKTGPIPANSWLEFEVELLDVK